MQKMIQLSEFIMAESPEAVPYDISRNCFEAITKIVLRNFPRLQSEKLGPISSVINSIQEHFAENITIEDFLDGYLRQFAD